jgi:exopolyphosphatase / guanosine-5'-triphosphate,3'-diphosphate pyrophosphatase
VAFSDHETVARLLGREPAGAFSVVVRGPGGSPAVIENAPLLYDGTPMPTRFWLVDSALREAVSRLEAAGGVRQATESVPPQAVEEAHALYAAERGRALPRGHTGPTPSGGVGGTRRGVKCLHAHLAWYLAGGADPVGRWTAERLSVRPGDFTVEGGVVPVSWGSVAAVDCGSNSTRLLIVGPDGAALEREMRITRLGEGVDVTHHLSPEAMDRTLTVLDEYRRLLDHHAVQRMRVVATSAARDADNAEQFGIAVRDLLGVRPEILAGDEEGRLSFVGATAHLPAEARGQVLVVDIGGGSTELAIGSHGVTRDPSSPIATTSLDIGCVRVSERFLRNDPPRDGEMADARAFVSELVGTARNGLPSPPPGSLLVGLAGTVSTLACLEFGIKEYDRARIHHSVLTRSAVERWLEVLSAETSRARLDHPGMVVGREDVIVGGALILSAVLETFGCDACLVSEDDILDGLVADLLAPDGIGGLPQGD